MAIKVGDRLPDGKLMEIDRVRLGYAVRDGAEGSERGRGGEGQEDRDLRPARRLHADLLGEARAELRAEQRRAEEERRERDLVRGDQRRLRHGALGPRPEGARQVRFLGDGSGAWTKALGLELDLNARGMGTRMQRFSMLVDNGVVKQLNVEAPGKFEVSDAGTMLKQL